MAVQHDPPQPPPQPPALPSGRPRGPQVRGSSWRWGVSVVFVVLLVVGGSAVARHLVAQARRPAPVAAPALPVLPVVAVTAPATSYELVALDAGLGHLVALTAPAQPQCPPVGACPPSPALERFVVLDGATARVLASTSLTGDAAPAAQSVALLADAAQHRAYAVAPYAVTIFSTDTGARLGGYTLPATFAAAGVRGAVLDAAHGTLVATAGAGLVTLDAATGRVLAQRDVSALGPQADGPALDPDSDAVFLLARGAGATPARLQAFDAATLAPVAQATLPVPAALGPVDPGVALAVFGADGNTYRFSLAHGAMLDTPSVTPDAAYALGWDATLGHAYVARPDGFQVRDSAGAPIAALPLRVSWAGPNPLLADASRGLLYLPAAHGAILVARDAATSDAGSLTPAAAAVLARAALPRYLPDTNQDPPFLDADTFWSATGTDSPATRTLAYYVHYSSDLGWQGPFPGTSTVAVAPLSGRPAAYRVTFTIAWTQLYPRTHHWTLDVAPDGSVSYDSDGGDVVP